MIYISSHSHHMSSIIENTSIQQTQLFRKIIPSSVLNEIIALFGLKDINDNRWFSKDTMKQTKTLSKMQEFSKKLSIYYLPCKARNYLVLITDKVCITIMRQILREFGYRLETKEQYIKKRKIILYRIVSKDNTVLVVSTSRSTSPDTKVANNIPKLKIDHTQTELIRFDK